jgi:pimeloyl-ACP methyl ester carboxylesterase
LSDHPNDTLVTLQSNAFVLHQIIQDLRNGTFDSTSFPKVLVVGHSFGTAVALYEASTNSDVDGLILTDLFHIPNPEGSVLFQSAFYPASQDPKFANSGFSSGYLTTQPGTRGQIFYNLSDADPNVIALDEQLKQTITVEETQTIAAAFDPTVSQSIHVPVLLAVGQNDLLFCNTAIGLPCNSSNGIVQREQSFYSPQACLEAFVLPNSGHAINLHRNAIQWFEAANAWANRRIGSSINNPPTQPCQ